MQPGGPPPRPGRGLVVAGSVLVSVAVLGGIVGWTLAARNVDVSALERDVVVDGPRVRAVPGDIDFEVQEPLREGTRARLTVGVAVDVRSGSPPACTLVDEDGRPVPTGGGLVDDGLLDTELSRFEVVLGARLDPGAYRASCAVPGEPSTADAEFTVGRVLGGDDVSDLLGPALAILAVVVVAGIVLVVGVVLLVVGLVRRNRPPPGPPWGGAPPPG